MGDPWVFDAGDPWGNPRMENGGKSMMWIHVWGIHGEGRRGYWVGSMFRWCRGFYEGPMGIPERIHQ